MTNRFICRDAQKKICNRPQRSGIDVSSLSDLDSDYSKENSCRESGSDSEGSNSVNKLGKKGKKRHKSVVKMDVNIDNLIAKLLRK